ncbi:hypothetical protein AOB60_00555 [Streptomyces noursei]|uniref:Uncharacterized protein n=1 Tax=Streptomyces noursei TaxID=1971 RepID=A0A2N8PR07_STRNR|nr:hypothetical protein AOB60_00555 [Streptomyces noursei]
MANVFVVGVLPSRETSPAALPYEWIGAEAASAIWWDASTGGVCERLTERAGGRGGARLSARSRRSARWTMDRRRRRVPSPAAVICGSRSGRGGPAEGRGAEVWARYPRP